MSNNPEQVDQKKEGPITPLKKKETKLTMKRDTTLLPKKWDPNPRINDPPLPARRVLVVDDDPAVVASQTELLEFLGQQVCTARDGPQALQAAMAFRPQVILLDIEMPGMDGYEVARRLRRREEFRSVLLVAVTGYSQPEDRQRAYEAGFDHHLAKPFGREEVEWLVALAK